MHKIIRIYYIYFKLVMSKEQSLKTIYGLTPHNINELLDSYMHRTFSEDIDVINSLGGDSGIAGKLKTHIANGLNEDEEELQVREEFFGHNKDQNEDEISLLSLILEALGDFMIQILIVAAIVQIGIGLSPLAQSNTDWIDGMAIVFAIFVVVITSAVTNYSKERKFQELKKINKNMFNVSVVRKGKTENMSCEDILVGDLVKLEYGMILPADGMLITGENVTVNESSITGESNEVSKEGLLKCVNQINTFPSYQEKLNTSIPSPLLISGTSVNSGSGWFLVLAVGKHSVKGKIEEMVVISKENSVSPLEIKLGDIANDIGMFGLFSAVLTFVALTVKLVFYKYEQYNFHKDGQLAHDAAHNHTSTNSTSTDKDSPFLLNPSVVFEGLPKEILSILMLCVTIIVVAIPEGLPLAVTLALSFSVRKMMDDNNLVRHLNACETMGGANYILSDKTGTLTQNVMTVVSIFNNSRTIDIKQETSSNELRSLITGTSHSKYINIIEEAITSNIDVEVNEKGEQTAGSKTDYSLYKLIKQLGKSYEQLKSSLRIEERIPFHSSRKRMSTLIKNNNNQVVVHLKGAKEYILNSCSHYINEKGVSLPLINNHIDFVNDICSNFSDQTHRCIALAYKELPSLPSNFKETVPQKSEDVTVEYEIEQKGFTLIGIIAINDNLKPNVPESIEICNKSGIKVVMITGDNKQTAVAIAKACNIIRPHEENNNGLVLTGQEFYSFIGGVKCRSCNKNYDLCQCPTNEKIAEEVQQNNDQVHISVQDLGVGNMTTFSQIAQHLKVLARARPIDKYALVLGLKELDNVVAVTGDGSNDAQALSKADVGFAMGIQGTEVAKNASDIIVLDDNFASIVSSIKWGRNIFDNIRKFIQFQLSVNLSAVLLVFVTSCIGSESPICPIQMLWLNLIMDSLGSLALATESPSEDLLLRKPYSRREYIVNSIMWKHIIIQSLVQFSLIFFLYIFAEKFIIEESEQRIEVIRQLENCFGDFSAEIIRYQKHSMIYYIVDGKKSSWSAMHLIKPNLDPSYCQFYDINVFPQRTVNNLEDAYRWYTSNYGNTTHMTIIFNCFVMYSLFNQVNSRIIDDSVNIFKRISSCMMFVFVFVVEIGVQVAIIEYGGLIFKCALGGLTFFQWSLCIAFASISFWTSIFAKFIPIERIGKIREVKRSSIHEAKEELIKNEN
jgi:P-type Ca2+ transporter type 2B